MNGSEGPAHRAPLPLSGRSLRGRSAGGGGPKAAQAFLCLILLGLTGCVASGSGDDLLWAGRPEAAAVSYSGLASDAPWLHRKLGLAFLRAGLLASAERELSRARELDPVDPSAVFFLAELAERRDDRSTGNELWQLYLRLRPGAEASLLAWEGAGDPGSLARARQRLRSQEEEAVIHPERRRTRTLLRDFGPRLVEASSPGAVGDDWNVQVTDARSWSHGIGGLPEFPPPPGRAP